MKVFLIFSVLLFLIFSPVIGLAGPPSLAQNMTMESLIPATPVTLEATSAIVPLGFNVEPLAVLASYHAPDYCMYALASGHAKPHRLYNTGELSPV